MDVRALPFVACPTCRGGGCIACADVGVFLPYGDRVLTWRREISETTFASEAHARAFERTLNRVLLLLAATGLGVFGVAVVLGASLFVPFTSHHPAFLLFWLSVLAGCAWTARIQRRRGQHVAIPSGEISEALSYGAISELPPERFLDVSAYVSADVMATIDAAYRITRMGRDPEVTPFHLFYALGRATEARFLFTRLGVNVEELSARVNEIVTQRAAEQETDQPPVVAASTWRIIFSAFVLAAAERHPLVAVRHMLRALFVWDDDLMTLLFERGVDQDMLDHVLEWLRSHEQIREVYLRFRQRARMKPKTTMNRALTARPTRVLDSVSDDLTLAARNGIFPPLIDREEEVRAMLESLTRGGSVLLLGDPGTGKTAMLQGLAQRMVSEDVPRELQDKRLVLLDAARLFANAAGGVAEARLARIVSEVAGAGNVVLAIEDLANLLGAKGSGTEMDLSDVVTQAMDLPRFQLVATSTVRDSDAFLQKFPAVLRRLERVTLAEPDAPTTILIAQAKCSEFEYSHAVFFTYGAVRFAVEGARRYLPHERLPASALKILENAAVHVRETKVGEHLVEREDVAAVLSRMTSIPVTAVTSEERERLLNLETVIHERLIDQDEAVTAVADSLRRARTELKDPNRPIANLLFLGPTGVGKTEMAKQVARIQFGAPDAMIRVDMTEYQQVSDLARLIGTPDHGGILTDAVRNRPYAVLLLDEFEKAHPDVLNVFLQVMDDGRLTDGRGNLVSFTNAIIIATSNAGTDLLTRELQAGRELLAIKGKLIQEILPTYFRPELLNRFDGVILFRPLAFEHVLAVAEILLREVQERLKQRGIDFEVSSEALADLAVKGNDPVYGARALRRVIQQDVDAALAKHVLGGNIDRRDRIILEKGGAIRIEKARDVQ